MPLRFSVNGEVELFIHLKLNNRTIHGWINATVAFIRMLAVIKNLNHHKMEKSKITDVTNQTKTIRLVSVSNWQRLERDAENECESIMDKKKGPL